MLLLLIHEEGAKKLMMARQNARSVMLPPTLHHSGDRSARETPPLSPLAELLKPIFHYLLEEPNLCSGINAMSLSLLLHLWFLHE
jgi:hypothetical protein